jgi:branched-chain amino acid transport system substrate-binding protein
VWVVDAKQGRLVKVDPVYGMVLSRKRISAPNPTYDISRESPDPTSIAAGLGYVWLTDGSRKLIRFDPKREIVHRVDLGHPLNGVAVGAGGVWVISGTSATVFRLDSRGKVNARVVVVSQPGFQSPYPQAIAVGEGFVWVLNGNTATVTKIDPEQLIVSATIRIGIERSPAQLAVGAGAVWVANGDGTLSRIDPDSGVVTPIRVAHNVRDVVVAGGRVWFTAGSGLGGSPGTSADSGTGRVRALPTSSCSPMYLAGGAHPQYLIASDLPLQASGSAAPQMSQAIQFVLRRHRFRAGRYAVAYQSCDDSTVPQGFWSKARCAANARAYAANASVLGVIGAFESGCSRVEVPIANRAPAAPLGMISFANTYVGLTHFGPGSATDEPGRYYPTGKRNYVRIIAADDIQGAANAILARQLGARRVYVLNGGYPGEAYGPGIAAAFQSAAVKLGLQVVGSGAWNPASARGYSRLGARVRQAQPDAVFLGGSLTNGALLTKLRGALGPDVELLAPDGFAGFGFPYIVQVAGAAAEGLTVSIPGLPEERLPEAGRSFVRAFGEAVGDKPILYSVYAAQAAEVLLSAIAASDGTRGSVTANLFKTKVSNGILGSFSIDRNGDTTAGAVTIYRIVGGMPRVFRVITPSRSLVR